MTTHDLRSIGRCFQISGLYQGAAAFGSGHINDTYRAIYSDGAREVSYIHQRINHQIFRDPPALMENIRRVLAHLKDKLDGAPDLPRRMLTLVSTRDGVPLHQDEAGGYWRTYLYIDNARTYDAVKHPGHALESAKAFGQFQKMLGDLAGPRLHDTIPDFHNTPKRFAALEQAIAADPLNRAKLAAPEIEFALRRNPLVSVLHDLQRRGDIPERIVHNDAKFNNVVIDDATQTGLCVVDLDTVMPGLALHDFGDMVRTTTSTTAEDERDLAKVALRLPMFQALVRGYLSSTGDFLNQVEKTHLVLSGKLVTFEVGIRFLADYLEGDRYFKVHREGHNLDRCRTQFKLLDSIEEQEEAMRALVEKEAG